MKGFGVRRARLEEPAGVCQRHRPAHLQPVNRNVGRLALREVNQVSIASAIETIYVARHPPVDVLNPCTLTAFQLDPSNLSENRKFDFLASWHVEESDD